MSSLLQSSRTTPKVYLTDKIQTAMSTAATSYGTNFGWQVIPFESQQMLLMNVPVQTNSDQQQYVMNTVTGAWCNFTGWNANCFELYEDGLYFGGTNYIGKAWDTNSDAGGAITSQGLQAFNYFGIPGMLKQFTMIRPTFYASSSPSVWAQINTGFSKAEPTATISTASSVGGLWGVGRWGMAVWGSALSLSRIWQGTQGLDYVGAPNIKTNTLGINLQWLSTDVIFRRGGIL